MIEHFVFQWINFFLLVGGLLYLLRKPVREFLFGRREKIRASIVKTRHHHEEACAKFNESKAKYLRIDADTEALKRSLTETGTFGQKVIIARARETAERIRKEADISAIQEHARARDSISKEALLAAFDEAYITLSRGVSRDDETRLLDESISVLNKLNG